jgi:predicted nuclease of predicted toxin-antitoxin system
MIQWVWESAKQHDFMIVSKDSDFHQRSFVFGFPPKVIWVQLGNCTTTEVEQVIRKDFDATKRSMKIQTRSSRQANSASASEEHDYYQIWIEEEERQWHFRYDG